MDVVFVRGGSKTAPGIAERTGMQYGTRHDYTSYASVFMLDINWKKYDWQQYLSLVRQYAPVMALAPDYEYPFQFTTLQRQIDDLRPLVKRVLVCPKFPGAGTHIPDDCIVAISVPAPTYASYLPPLHELANRKIHLLGGSIEKQVDLIVKLAGFGAQVVSVDGSYIAMAAGHGRMFVEGVWVQTPPRQYKDDELLEVSATNYVKVVRWALEYCQLPLF